MYSEQLALMLFMAATQLGSPNAPTKTGPVVEDARHAMIRQLKEPELVAALTLRAQRQNLRKATELPAQTLPSKTLLASR